MKHTFLSHNNNNDYYWNALEQGTEPPIAPAEPLSDRQYKTDMAGKSQVWVCQCVRAFLCLWAVTSNVILKFRAGNTSECHNYTLISYCQRRGILPLFPVRKIHMLKLCKSFRGWALIFFFVCLEWGNKIILDSGEESTSGNWQLVHNQTTHLPIYYQYHQSVCYLDEGFFNLGFSLRGAVVAQKS